MTEDHIVSILIARRGREGTFGANLFSEPAWDVLLELYAAKLGMRTMSLSDLAKATGVPPSTTERWVRLLEARGFVASEQEGRRESEARICLTELGASKMKNLADHWGAAFLSI
jgi:DNA-binding MarR family transcriptional regulator